MTMIHVEKETMENVQQTNLRTSTFTDSKYAVLVRMEAHPNLAHWLGVSYGGREVAFPIKPSKETLPLIMTLRSVWQAPRYQVNHLTC
jgi:hypothetical protein